jgi:hypothetical protein
MEEPTAAAVAYDLHKKKDVHQILGIITIIGIIILQINEIFNIGIDLSSISCVIICTSILYSHLY